MLPKSWMHKTPKSDGMEGADAALLHELAELETEIRRREARRKLYTYAPKPKQAEFHNAGGKFNQRLFLAGNQLGKTWAGAHETAMHLTGIYPEWWQGKRYSEAVRAWAGGVTTQAVRDSVQRLLVGPPMIEDEWGTGVIPGDLLLDTKKNRGFAQSLDSIIVRHASGGVSTLGLRSYDQGRAKWQAETLDFVWFDEEPPVEIYSEGLQRTATKGVFLFITFTPLMGATEVVNSFIGHLFQERGKRKRSDIYEPETEDHGTIH